MQQHEELTQHASADDRQYVAPGEEEEEDIGRHTEDLAALGEPRRSWASALTSPLDELADDEVIEVLEEALRENSAGKDKEHGLGLDTTSENNPSRPATWQPILSRDPLVRLPTAAAAAAIPFPTRTSVSLITLVLAIRTRPTYRHILSTISPSLFRALLTHLVVDIGAIHLVHLLLHDISTRSFGRLEIVQEVLDVCCRSSAVSGGLIDVAQATEGPAVAQGPTTVDKRHILNLLEMLDDSYFCSPSTRDSTIDILPAQHGLNHQTLRILLKLAVDDTPSTPGSAPRLAIDPTRLVRIAGAFAKSVRPAITNNTIETEEDIWLMQQTLLSLVRAHETKAGQELHKILLGRQWIIDDPCLQRPANANSRATAKPALRRRLTSLGVCIALINTLNQHQQPIRALQLIELAVREQMVKPHSSLGPLFGMSVNTTCRIVIASRSPAALEKMGGALPWVISSGKVDVSPRIVKAFYDVCNEDVEGKGRGTMKRFVRALWERAVDIKTIRITAAGKGHSNPQPEIQQFLPTGRPLAHLLEYMARKSTPWEGSDAAMLRWLVQTITVKPAAFLEPATAGAVIVALLSFETSALPRRFVKTLYERIVDERDDGERETIAYPTNAQVPRGRSLDDHFARDRLRMGLVTNSEAMLKLVQVSVSRSVTCTPPPPRPDGSLDPAMLIVQRYIQSSPSLAQLSVDDLARLARAFFLLGNMEAGVRMVKYVIAHRPPPQAEKTAKRKPGRGAAAYEDKAVRILRWGLTYVPSSAGQHYLELLDLALAHDPTIGSTEVVTSKLLLENFMRKGIKALGFCQSSEMSDRQLWKDRLEALHREWEKRYNLEKDFNRVVNPPAS